MSGGQAGAENGKLTIMVGGDAAPFARAEPVLAHYAKAVTLMGGPGAGQLTKMVNQICIAGLVQALSEGINFAERAGLDAERVLDVISKGAAQSWQMENRGRTMVADKFDFGFAVDWMRKDLGICLAEARANGSALPVTALVDQFYARVQAQGGGRWDTSSLVRLLRDADDRRGSPPPRLAAAAALAAVADGRARRRRSPLAEAWTRPAAAGQPASPLYVDIASTRALTLVDATSPLAEGAGLRTTEYRRPEHADDPAGAGTRRRGRAGPRGWRRADRSSNCAESSGS